MFILLLITCNVEIGNSAAAEIIYVYCREEIYSLRMLQLIYMNICLVNYLKYRSCSADRYCVNNKHYYTL